MLNGVDPIFKVLLATAHLLFQLDNGFFLEFDLELKALVTVLCVALLPLQLVHQVQCFMLVSFHFIDLSLNCLISLCHQNKFSVDFLEFSLELVVSQVDPLLLVNRIACSFFKLGFNCLETAQLSG